jgi:hypothetical protein
MGKPKGRRAASSGTAATKKEKATGWVASTFSKADLNKLRAAEILAAATVVMMPGKDTLPHPQKGYRVMFSQFLFRGLSLPVHEFLRGLLFVYGVQLHQLTPNSILHIACFITVCECFLGIDPHWGLWRRIFCIRRNISRTDVHDVGGAIISTKSPAGYFDLRMRESLQDWRRKCFYIKDELVAGQIYGLAPFDDAAEVKKLKSWDIPLTVAELEETEPMIHKIQTLQTTVGKELLGLQLMAFFLRMRVQPL